MGRRNHLATLLLAAALSFSILAASCGTTNAGQESPQQDAAAAVDTLVQDDAPGGGGGCSALAQSMAAGAASEPQAPAAAGHVIDGQFTGSEWDNAVRLEGVLTDVFVDYADGVLYFLNDWRANVQGIRPDCFNEFHLAVAGQLLTLKVHGDGRVTVDGASVEAQGAYGFGPSPLWEAPHTIFEFSVSVPEGPVAVCCMDPTTMSTCDQLVEEGVLFAIEAGSTVKVGRVVGESVTILAEGASCGAGQGVCAFGFTCTPQAGGGATCVGAGPG